MQKLKLKEKPETGVKSPAYVRSVRTLGSSVRTLTELPNYQETLKTALLNGVGHAQSVRTTPPPKTRSIEGITLGSRDRPLRLELFSIREGGAYTADSSITAQMGARLISITIQMMIKISQSPVKTTHGLKLRPSWRSATYFVSSATERYTQTNTNCPALRQRKGNNGVNCGKPVATLQCRMVIRSQAQRGRCEGSETRARSLDQTVKPHERAAPHAGDDIVRYSLETARGRDKEPEPQQMDSPHVHDAGTPYAPHPNLKEDWNEDGTPKWQLYAIVLHDGDYFDEHSSVDQINKRMSKPWVQAYNDSYNGIGLFPGDNLRTVVDRLDELGAGYYLPNRPL